MMILLLDPVCQCRECVASRTADIRLQDIGLKCAARIILASKDGGIIIPDLSEWFGVGLLERDGEL